MKGDAAFLCERGQHRPGLLELGCSGTSVSADWLSIGLYLLDGVCARGGGEGGGSSSAAHTRCTMAGWLGWLCLALGWV